MIEKQNASLVLENYYLPTTANNVGVRNSANTSFTWYNLNLRTILGDMWNKYDYFKLVLVEISTAPTAGSGGPTGSSLTQNLYIGGLPFINSTYNSELKMNMSNTVLTTFTFGGANASANKLYNGVNMLTFRKEQEQCDITIYYNTIGSKSAPTGNFPNITFIFNIVGVEIDKDENMKSRMIK